MNHFPSLLWQQKQSHMSHLKIKLVINYFHVSYVHHILIIVCSSLDKKKQNILALYYRHIIPTHSYSLTLYIWNFVLVFLPCFSFFCCCYNQISPQVSPFHHMSWFGGWCWLSFTRASVMWLCSWLDWRTQSKQSQFITSCVIPLRITNVRLSEAGNPKTHS